MTDFDADFRHHVRALDRPFLDAMPNRHRAILDAMTNGNCAVLDLGNRSLVRHCRADREQRQYQRQSGNFHIALR